MASVTLSAAAGPPPSPGFRPLRVLAVIPGDGQGTNFIFARRQVDSLRPFAGAVETFFFDTSKSPLAFARNSRALLRALQTFRPDIVHAHYGTMTALACSLVVNKPLIVTFRGSDLNPEPGYGWLRTRLGIICSQLAALRCAKIICVSRQLATRLWWRKSRIVVLPTGVDLRLFRPMNRAEARHFLGWDLQKPVLLFNAGRAPAVKGLDLAEKVAARIASRLPIRFEVMRGDIAPDRVPTLMNAADCLLVTSRSEGSPNVVREALACGLPVVSVDVGGVREQLEGVRPSRIVSRDADEIATAAQEILTKRARSNGPTAAQRVSDRNIAEQLMTLYGSVGIEARSDGSA